jgi:hypothetical protein
MTRTLSFPHLPFINTSFSLKSRSASPSPSPRSSQSSSPCPIPRSTQPRPSLYQRRALSSFTNRLSSNNSPPPLTNLTLPPSPFGTNGAFSLEPLRDGERESDQECWERMLMLQREFHCYKSARMEAAVEALERGFGVEEVAIREFSFV